MVDYNVLAAELTKSLLKQYARGKHKFIALRGDDGHEVISRICRKGVCSKPHGSKSWLEFVKYGLELYSICHEPGTLKVELDDGSGVTNPDRLVYSSRMSKLVGARLNICGF